MERTKTDKKKERREKRKNKEMNQGITEKETYHRKEEKYGNKFF